jgi:DNA-binding beta-propeller fold protein YncE
VAVDGAGNLFVSDSSNHTIRQVVVATGAVTTLAGTAGMTGSTDATGAAARFNIPQGVAVDGAGNLFVTDTKNNTVRKVQLSNAVVTTVVGIAGQRGVMLGVLPARLNIPVAVAALPSGDLFILDENSVLSVR